MGPKEIANQYYDAWINHHGDMGEVPLAEDMVAGRLAVDPTTIQVVVRIQLPKNILDAIENRHAATGRRDQDPQWYAEADLQARRLLRDYGIGTYVRNLLRHLSRIDQETEYAVLCQGQDCSGLSDLGDQKRLPESERMRVEATRGWSRP